MVVDRLQWPFMALGPDLACQKEYEHSGGPANADTQSEKKAASTTSTVVQSRAGGAAAPLSSIPDGRAGRAPRRVCTNEVVFPVVARC